MNRVASTRHGVSYSVKVLGGYAYVTGNDGVSVFVVADHSQPRLVATLEMADGAFDLTFIGTTAYIAGDEEGLVILEYGISEASQTAWMNYILSTAVSLALVIGVLVYTKVLKR